MLISGTNVESLLRLTGFDANNSTFGGS